MEDTLREGKKKNKIKVVKCLNPCFNGRYSTRAKIIFHCISTTSAQTSNLQQYFSLKNAIFLRGRKITQDFKDHQ